MMREVHMEVGGDYTAREGYLIIRIIFGTVYCTLKVTNLLRSGIPREVHKGLGMARGDDTAREGYLDIQIILKQFGINLCQTFFQAIKIDVHSF